MKINGIQLDESNQEFYNAAKFVENTNRHLFLTGKAGTGKTTFLKYLKTSLYKNAVVLAYTGVAAVNAGGNTINSFFKIRPSVYFPEDKRLRISAKNDPDDSSTIWDHFRLDKRRVEIINAMELMIIDEVSMLRCDLLDVVDKILRVYRKSLDRPFGGVQVVLLGDLFQLPPIAQYSEWEILSRFYKTPFFFSSKAIEQLVSNKQLTYIELKKIYRQREMDFVNLLNRVRLNEISDKDLAVLNHKYNPTFSKPRNKNFITLATHNHLVDQENKIELEKLPGDPVCFEAEISGNFPDSMYPTDLNLELKTGAQVMFLKNDMGEDKRYYNGKIGKLTNIGEEYLLIETEDDTIKLHKHEWENIRYEWDKEEKKIVERIEGTFTQFPVKLAWAVTVHKSQGLTFENVVADLGGAWDSGQVYVALSRCTSYNGLVLKSKISRNNIKTDEDVIAFSKNETPDTLVLEALTDNKIPNEKNRNNNSNEKVINILGEPENKETNVNLHQILLNIKEQFGPNILGEERLKGLLSEMRPKAEDKRLRIFNQAVNDGIGAKLLEMVDMDKSGRDIKINALKDTFKNRNGFNNSAEYVVDCFLFALGWLDDEPKDDQNQVQVYNLDVLKQSVEMAFSDGILTKEEARSLFAQAETLQIPEPNVVALITDQIKTNSFKPGSGFEFKTLSKEIIFAQNWFYDSQSKHVAKKFEATVLGNQIWMEGNLDVSNFRNGDPIPEAKTDEEWKKAGEEGKPAWCYYDNDPENGKDHGKLYNWYAVNDLRGLAPVGWHVPSKEEWDEVADSIRQIEFSNLFISSGIRYEHGWFDGIGRFNGLWFSTEEANKTAWMVDFCDEDRYAEVSYCIKSKGFNVRCIRDIMTSLKKASTLKIIQGQESIFIGKQIWMKRNLNVSHFGNGDPIPEAKTKEEWKKAGEEGKPAWCYYDNDSENGKIYGKLYNWFAVTDPRGIAPSGWHVPSPKEWSDLIDFLGEYEVPAYKLKSTEGWRVDDELNDNWNGNDEVGFSALPGGRRNEDGEFESILVESIWWSSSVSENSSDNAYHFDIGSFHVMISLWDIYSKNCGFSLRCLKD